MLMSELNRRVEVEDQNSFQFYPAFQALPLASCCLVTFLLSSYPPMLYVTASGLNDGVHTSLLTICSFRDCLVGSLKNYRIWRDLSD